MIYCCAYVRSLMNNNSCDFKWVRCDEQKQRAVTHKFLQQCLQVAGETGRNRGLEAKLHPQLRLGLAVCLNQRVLLRLTREAGTIQAYKVNG